MKREVTHVGSENEGLTNWLSIIIETSMIRLIENESKDPFSSLLTTSDQTIYELV